MSTSLLFIGDVHLGRRPDRVAVADLDPRRYSPAVAWRRAVDLAIHREVSAVVLAGDLVDQERDRFEAYRHLEGGVRRLAEMGIEVVGVAGNHDGLVLPRLAGRIDDFRLLGAGGAWELLRLNSSPPVDLLGWSFPAAHHRTSPLESRGLDSALGQRRPGAACLGVIHGDLGATNSPYAPLSREQLGGLGLEGWLLGHIHAPDDLHPSRPLGYLGSLVGLDRGEDGEHGAWLVTVSGQDRLDCRLIAVGPLRWENVDVDVSQVPDDDGAEDALHVAIEQALRTHKADNPSLGMEQIAAVGCSLCLTGRTPARRRLRSLLSLDRLAEFCFDLDGQPWATIKIRDASRPALDLGALARQKTPVGQLAQLILDLEVGNGESATFLEGARQAMDSFSAGHWSLDAERWPMPDAREVTLAASYRLLDALMSQGGEENTAGVR